MSKKGLAIAAAVGVGIFAEMAIHGYIDVMARSNNFKSLLGYLGTKSTSDDVLSKFNETKQDWISQQNTEHISIKSDRGERLQGYLTYPEKESNIFVFCAHGYHASHAGDPANFLQYYVEKGYNFFCVDHVASGDSEGKFVGFNYFECPDCLKWLDYIIERFGEDIKIILHGVSMGGATVCKMADKIPSQVKLIIADCPYTSGIDEFNEFVRSAGIKKSEPFVKVFNSVNKVVAGYDLKDTDVRESVINAKVPMLFVHGTKDTFVPTKMGIELYELCGSEKELYLVEDATHARSIVFKEKEYHQKLDDFIEKYL